MKYPKIQSLVPNGEHFDESGIINEGGFLSVQHLNSIEQFLETHQPALEQANDMIATHESTIADLNTAVDAHAKTIQDLEAERDLKAARVTELENEVKELGKQESGKGTKIISKADPAEEKENTLPRFDSPDHPANKMAKKFVKK